MIHINRRQALALGCLAAADMLLSKNKLFASVAAGEIKNPSLIGALDNNYESLRDQYFPEIASRREAAILWPFSAIILNQTKEPVYGCSFRWLLVGPNPANDSYHRRFIRRASIHLEKRTRTYVTPFLDPGEAGLVTPFFLWTSSFYQENRTKLRVLQLTEREMSDYASRYPAGNGFMQRNSDRKIKVALESAIFQGYVAGKDAKKMDLALRNQCNAEHDEALYLLTAVRTGKADSKDTLLRLADASADHHRFLAGSRHKTYELARAMFAKKVFYALNSRPFDEVVEALTEVQQTPPIETRAMPSLSGVSLNAPAKLRDKEWRQQS